jgi:hypothetical protein
MHAIELTSTAHEGQVTLSIPEAYRHDWNDKPVRVILMVDDEPPARPKGSLLSSLKAIQIEGPEDLSERHDAYINGSADA